MENYKFTETEIIEGCKSNNNLIQKVLFENYYSLMKGVCLRYAKNDAQADDFVQEGFIKVFKNIHTIKNDSNLGGWIRRTMVNTCIDALRKEKMTLVNIDDCDYGLRTEETEEEVGYYGEIIEALGTDEILKEVQNLSNSYKIAFNLYVIDNYSHKEVGEILNISEGSSKSNVFKAKQKLKEAISKKYESLKVQV